MKKYRAKGKRWLAAMLSMLMIASGMLSVPISSYAAETGADSMEAVKEEVVEQGDDESTQEMSPEVSETPTSEETLPTPEESASSAPEQEEEVTPSTTPGNELGEEPAGEPTMEPETTPSGSPVIEEGEELPTPSVSPVPSVEPLVQAEELAYLGDSNKQTDGSYTLHISQSQIQAAGMEWNAETALNILKVRASEDIKYTYIDLTGSKGDWTEKLPMSLWNQMLESIDTSDAEHTATFSVGREGGENELDETWSFFYPVYATSDIDTSVSYELMDYGLKFSGKMKTFPLKYGCSLQFSASNSKKIFSRLENTFNADTTYYISKTNGEKASDFVDIYKYENEDFSNIGICIYDNGVLQSGQEYQITEYLGTIGENNGNKWLTILNQGKVFTENQLLRILDANKEHGPFTSINIYQDGTDTDTIWSSVMNKARSMMTGNKSVYWEFTENDTGFSPAVTIYDPDEINTDIKLEITFENTNGIPKFSVNTTQIPAKRVQVGIQGYSYKGSGRGFEILRAMLGEESKLIAARKEQGNGTVGGFYRFGEDSNYALLYFEDLTELEPNVQYILSERPSYCGTITETNGWRELLVDNSSGEYTNEQLVDILNLNKSGSFNRVRIWFDQSKESGIPMEVHNAACRLFRQKETTDPNEVVITQMEYRYKSEDNSVIALDLHYPETIDSDIKSGVLPGFSAKNNGVYYINNTCQYPAQNVDVTFIKYNDSTGFADLKNFMGTAKGSEFTAWHGMNKITGKYYYYTKSKTYPEQMAILITDIQELDSGAEYVVGGYQGSVEDNNLYLRADDIDKAQFSEKDIQNTVNYYKGQGVKFSHITIDQDYSNSKATAYTISKGMINAIREILAENGELVFCFSRGVTTGEGADAQYLQNDLNLNLVAPGEASKDITINMTLTPVTNQGITFKINKSKIEANAKEVGLQVYVNPKSDLGNRIQSVLGDPDSVRYQVIVLKNDGVDESVYCDYSEENGNYSLLFRSIGAWEKDVTYKIVTWKTPLDSEGQPVEFEKGRTVSLKAIHPEYDGKKVTWKSYSSGVVSDISADGEMSVFGETGEEFYYSATYVSDKVTYVDYWRGYVNQARIDSISFDRDKIVMVLPDDTDTSISEEEKENQKIGYLNVRFNPSTAAVDPTELEWSVDNEDVVELLTDKEGNYTGEFKVCKAGTAVIEAAYPDTDVKASCTVVVQKSLTDAETGADKLDNLYAVSNFDQTLADIKLPSNWKWKVPATKLSEYGDAQGYNFPAVYTAEDGRSVSRMLYVRFVKIDSISTTALTMKEKDGKTECLPDALPKEIVKGDKIVLGVQYKISNGDVTELEKCRDQFAVKWECKNKSVLLSEKELDSYWEDSIQFSATDDSKKEKKTVTLSLVDKNTNKVVMKASAQISVLDGNLMDWVKLETNAHDNTADEFYFKVPQNDYYKLTFKSSDEKVLKLGKVTTKEVTEEDAVYVITTVAYKNLTPGISYLTITAADEAKSSISIRKEWRDVAPKVENDKVTIDKALKDNSAEIVLYADYTSPIDVDNVQLVQKDQNFIITDRQEVVVGEVQKVIIKIEPANNEIKTSKHKVDLSVPVIVDEQEENHSVKIVVTVKETKPVVTFKQTKKVNLFYTDTEGDGLLTVTAPDGITDLQLTNCDYTLSRVDGSDTEYRIQLKADANRNQINAKGTLEYKVPGYQKKYTASIKVASENKAPSIGLSQTKDTLYPNIQRDFSELILTDKTTGERLQLDQIELVLKTGNIKLSDVQQTIQIGKNRYLIGVADQGQGKSLHISLWTKVKATDTIVLNVQEDNWSKALKVTYKISVEVKTPTIELGNKKLVLNKNEGLFTDEIAETTVRWKGNSALIQNSSVRFEGLNKASSQILNKCLVLEYLKEDGVLIARLNAVKLKDVELKTGTYKYKVWVDNVSTTLDINIVDKEAVKCVGLSKAGGSIDVLQRENTALYYKVKLTNLTGTVQGVYLEGTDGDLFEGTMNDKGQLQISARDWASLSTKASYKVQPILIVENEHGGSREVPAPVQTIKVKQGSPKVTMTVGGNAFYRQRNNEIVITLNSVLNGQKVAIEDVYLGNLTDRFELVTDEEGWAFDSNTDSITLKMKDDSELVYGKAGTKYTLNLMIRYKDRAGNEKDQKVTYAVIVN